MYHPKTLTKMAELKRQETQRKLAQRQILKDRQPEKPQLLTGIIQYISGRVKRLTAPKTTDSASDSRIGRHGKQALSG